MGNCEQMRRVGAYHDGELSPEEQSAFEAHVAGCAVCAAELKQLRSLSCLLTGAELPGVPAEVLQRLREAPRRSERTFVRWAEVLMAAAAIILVVCASWTFAAVGQGTAATGAETPWATTAMTLNVDTSMSQSQVVAQWMVNDLSSEDSHE